MLQYDNSAFYFFLLSTISFYLVPSWYYILKKVYKVLFTSNEELGAVARTSSEKQKAETLKAKKSSELFQQSFLIHVTVTVLLTILFVWLLFNVMQDGQVNSFDPFSILEIDRDSDNKVIKKAYRTLSLKYHPDKNPGDRVAEAKFMMVAKAYEALTDAESRENFEKYGNPDGKQSLEVSIGLPSFLLEGTYRNLVLVSYLVVMVVIIPFCVYTYYSDSSKYGEKDVMYDTYSWYHHSLSEHTVLKSLPETLAGSAEFRSRNVPDNEQKSQIASLTTQVRSHMLKPKYNHPVCVFGNVLLHTHLLRKTSLLSEPLQDQLRYMLERSTSLLDAMISVCKHQDNLQTALTCMEFGQYLTQAVWVKDSPLLQLPHFSSDEVKHAQSGKNAVSTVSAFCDLAPDERKGMVHFTKAQKDDVHAFLQLYPNVTVTTRVYVDDDEDDKVYEGDLCTVEVRIERHNIKKGERVGLVHAPFFPVSKREAFWVVLGQKKEGRILSVEKVGNPGQTIVHKIKFLAPPVGHYEFDLFVKSNAYIGVDQQLKVTMDTQDNSTLPEYKVHPDDAELDDEPTLFEEMLNAHVEQDSDDDSDSDEEEEEDPKAKTSRRRRQDQDSDSDDEAEEVYADK